MQGRSTASACASRFDHSYSLAISSVYASLNHRQLTLDRRVVSYVHCPTTKVAKYIRGILLVRAGVGNSSRALLRYARKNGDFEAHIPCMRLVEYKTGEPKREINEFSHECGRAEVETSSV